MVLMERKGFSHVCVELLLTCQHDSPLVAKLTQGSLTQNMYFLFIKIPPRHDIYCPKDLFFYHFKCQKYNIKY